VLESAWLVPVGSRAIFVVSSGRSTRAESERDVCSNVRDDACGGGPVCNQTPYRLLAVIRTLGPGNDRSNPGRRRRHTSGLPELAFEDLATAVPPDIPPDCLRSCCWTCRPPKGRGPHISALGRFADQLLGLCEEPLSHRWGSDGLQRRDVVPRVERELGLSARPLQWRLRESAVQGPGLVRQPGGEASIPG
jgi:hypothetical protein